MDSKCPRHVVDTYAGKDKVPHLDANGLNVMHLLERLAYISLKTLKYK